MDSKTVINSLMLMHPPDEYAFFEELRIGTGYGKDSEQRFDAWAIHYHPSKRNVSLCYEIKVSKSDFKKEISSPLKRRAGLRLSNEFYFVTPKHLCKIEEIPPECGLMEVGENGTIETVVKAPFRDIMFPTWLFVAAICRRLDVDRKHAYEQFLAEDTTLKRYGSAAISVLERRAEAWRNFNDGNKEVPDIIAEELSSVKAEVEEVVRINLKIK